MAKYSEKNKSTRRINLPMTISMVLFYLTLISIYLTSGLYAKYTTQSNAGDGARVIKFGGLTLEETGDFAVNSEGKREFVIIPGVNLTKNVQISFTGSEADTYVFVVAEMPGWTRSEYKFSIMSKPVQSEGEELKVPVELVSLSINSKDWTYLTTTGDKHVFYCLLESNTKLKEAKFVDNAGKITVSSQMTKKDIETMKKDLETGKEFAMNLAAYVVQGNGFESATQAWESLSQN